MSNKQKRFPTLPVMVLVTGLIAIAVVLLVFSYVPIPSAATRVDSIEQAKQLAEEYIGSSADLEVAEIMEFQNNFYVRVQEKSTGINAYELLVDRYTGSVTPEPGPNMMWNTKYGMMSWFRGAPTADMPINVLKAAEYGQQWLDANIQGAKIEKAEAFYGYYTADVSLNGTIYGMLSVNGNDGDVWYHTWHGTFIAMQEYD